MKSNSHAHEFFLFGTVPVCFYVHKANAIFLDKQAKLHEGKQPRQLQRLSDTWWACRYFALDTLANTFDSILATLETIADSSDKPKAVEAIGILVQVCSFKFLACLIIFLRIMSVTKSLSDNLQCEQMDMVLAADLVFTPQLAGEARQLGCPKIVLDHVRVCIYIIYILYICMYAPQCLSTRCIGGTSIGDALATGIQAPAGPCKLMNIAIPTNCIKYQMLHVSLI